MKILQVAIFGILFGCILVEARYRGKHIDDDAQDTTGVKEKQVDIKMLKQDLHRRKRWLMNYGYPYPPPEPFYSNEYNRQDTGYDKHQDDLRHILRLLDDLSYRLRQQQQPQPIYIQVPYVVPQQCDCSSSGQKPDTPLTVNVTRRWPAMEDSRQNWGFVANNKKVNTNDVDYTDDSVRPLSFTPAVPDEDLSRRPPRVDHGSTQDGRTATTGSPLRQASPTNCDAALLACCQPDQNLEKQRNCLRNLGCFITSDRNTCQSGNLRTALERLSSIYSFISN